LRIPHFSATGGFFNLPAQTTVSTAAVTYKVPASGAYPGLPSPSQLAGNALVIGVDSGDITSGGVVDNGNSFAVRVNGKLAVSQSEAVTLTIYQASAAAVAAGFTAVSGTGQNALATFAATITTANNFSCEVILNWDATSLVLNGYKTGIVGGTLTAQTAITPVTALTERDLNFYFGVTMGSTGTGDTFGGSFTWERA